MVGSSSFWRLSIAKDKKIERLNAAVEGMDHAVREPTNVRPVITLDSDFRCGLWRLALIISTKSPCDMGT
jgi:hypothetical protein